MPDALRVRYVNGSVFTGLRERPWVEAVAVSDGRIVGSGSRAEVTEATPGAEEIDLGGRTLLPGLIDAHNHFLATGEMLGSISLQQLKPSSKQQLLDIVATAVSETDDDPIHLAGLDPAKLDGGAPNRWELDAVSQGRAVFVQHVSGHGVLVNSTVLERTQVGERTQDPAGGWFERDADGRPTGLCMDAAMGVVMITMVDIRSHGPNFHVFASDESLASAVDRAQKAFVAAGLTTVCDAQVTRREMRAYLAAERNGQLTIRTVCMPLSHQLEEFGDVGIVGPFGNSRVRIGPMKFYADGSLIGHTALCSHGYGPNGDNGYLYRGVQEFEADVLTAHRDGWSIGVHAQGDSAIQVALDALERAQKHHPRADTRPRIEHAGLPTPEQVSQMSRMGVIAVNQPSYLYELGDQFIEDFGDEVHRMQPWREELDAGVRVVISSDSDVASYRPLHTIAAALERSTMSGQLIGPDQAMTMDEALFAHTVDAAYAVRWEDEIGSLAPGMRADLTVIDGDLHAASPAEIRQLPVWQTVVGGEVVFTEST
jgi:predicted amidohydrolase YtcJ